MIDPAHMPRPVTIAEPRRMPRAAVALLTVGGLLGLLILGRLAWTITEPIPIANAETSPQTFAHDSSVTVVPATFPAELLMAAVALSTFVAPTPAPATPEPYAMSTVPPTILCGEWVQYGTTCTMPKAPKPTPTPLSTCPVAPNDDCVWRGGRTARVTDDR